MQKFAYLSVKIHWQLWHRLGTPTFTTFKVPYFRELHHFAAVKISGSENVFAGKLTI
jgi:hypothetical protein